MSKAILKGLSVCLAVALLTAVAGLFWNTMGLSQIAASNLVDIGLVVCCLAGGYQSGKESSLWLLGGATGGGFVAISSMVLSVFIPVSFWGASQVVGEGIFIGLLGGAVGRMSAGKSGGPWLSATRPVYRRRERALSWDNEPWERTGEIYREEENEDLWIDRPQSEMRSTDFSQDDISDEKYSNDNLSPWWEQDAKHER